MSDRRDDRLRELLEEIDARLRDAERIRNHAEHSRATPFWPDRRRAARVPAPHSADEPTRDSQNA
jgi:hypothetical protein